MAADRDWLALQASFLLYREGNSEVTRDLFEGITKKLSLFFRNRTGRPDEAEDLTQATLLKIHFARDRFDSAQSLKTWVYTIAGRSLIDHWRGRATESEVFEKLSPVSDEPGNELEQIPSLSLGPDQKIELGNDLQAALNTLKPIDRSIVYLYGVEGFSMSEIAKVLNLTEAATKLRAHRSYKELRQILSAIYFLLLYSNWMATKWMF